jgi:hypothetical protein
MTLTNIRGWKTLTRNHRPICHYLPGPVRSSHGGSFVGPWVLGSVTERIIHHLRDPVLATGRLPRQIKVKFQSSVRPAFYLLLRLHDKLVLVDLL